MRKHIVFGATIDIFRYALATLFLVVIYILKGTSTRLE